MTYWRPFGAQGTSGPDSDGAVAGAWFPKRFAAAFGHRADALAGLWAETAAAAVHAAGSADPRATVATQGHVLPVPDFVATLVVEVTAHSLDLAVALPEAAPPAAGLIATPGVYPDVLL